MEPALVQTLRELARWTDRIEAPWWLIGSAAMALHGLRDITVADVDLLVAPPDARRLAELWDVEIRPAKPSPLFRSEVYFQWERPPIPVDVMAGFQLRQGETWTPVRPATRVPVSAGGAVFFTPTLAEQVSILEAFDRPKDRDRASRLREIL